MSRFILPTPVRGLSAVASVHNLLTEGSWRSVRPHDLVQAVLAPHAAGERVRFRVEEAILKLVVAQTFALLLHQLRRLHPGVGAQRLAVETPIASMRPSNDTAPPLVSSPTPIRQRRPPAALTVASP